MNSVTGALVEPLRAAVRFPAAAGFDDWMRAEQRRVFLLCYRMLGDRDEADTATQDAFLKAHLALRRGQAPAVEEPGRWIVRIAVNTCLDRLRSRAWKFWKRRQGAVEESATLGGAATGDPSPEDRLFAVEIERRLRTAIESLSARQRAVFTLRHYEDRPLEEIAAILAVDCGTVKAHLSRALVKLRVELRDLYGMKERDEER
jgi:RNA polymerase sigma-70 factor, ECF subfamily